MTDATMSKVQLAQRLSRIKQLRDRLDQLATDAADAGLEQTATALRAIDADLEQASESITATLNSDYERMAVGWKARLS